MKFAPLAAAALLSLSITGAAAATPSLSYATPPSNHVSAEFTEAKFKFKKFGHSRGFKRGHFRGSRFGHRSFGGAKYGHFGKKGFVGKRHGGKKFFFGKGVFFK